MRKVIERLLEEKKLFYCKDDLKVSTNNLLHNDDLNSREKTATD